MWEEYAPSLSSLSVLLLHQSGSAGSKAEIMMSYNSLALGTSLVEVFETTLASVPDAKSEFVSTSLLMEVQVFFTLPRSQ